MQAIAKKEDIMKVYEIGYLLVSSVPKEKVADTVAELKSALEKRGATIVAEESPELRPLAYTMVKKVGATNHRFDEGYFSWVKFDLATKEIESVKKAFEEHPNMLRVLVMTTVRENTYLGKKSPVITRSEDVVSTPEAAPAEVVPEAPVASAEEIDKSIDEMVK